MDDLILRRIQVWQETQKEAYRIGSPPSLKFARHQMPKPTRRSYLQTDINVADMDCLECAAELQRSGRLPVVLNLSDDEYAGGAVDSGSGAQEESLWRRTALCATQTQEFYPLCESRDVFELLYSTGVPVLRASEAMDYAWLPTEARWYCDFIACPALKYPATVRDPRTGAKDVTLADEVALEGRLRLILDTAAYMGNDAVVLGAMGCGAWRTPVGAVARVFGRVLPDYAGVFRDIIVAILTTHSTDPTTIPLFRAALRLVPDLVGTSH